jgi:putative transcriptional regulator
MSEDLSEEQRRDIAARASLSEEDMERRAAAGPDPAEEAGWESVPSVRELRARLGLSIAAFAERYDLSQQTVREWDQGGAIPDRTARAYLRAIERAPDTVADLIA